MKTKKRFLSILLSLALMLGLMPGMSLTAYAEGETITVTWKSTDFSGQTHTKDGVTINDPGVVYNKGKEVEIGKHGQNWTFTSSFENFTKIEVTGGWTNTFPGNGDGWNGRTWTGDSPSVSASGVITDANGSQPWTITFTIKPVNVTGVTLNPSTAQSINVGGSVAFTATVAPDGATDKTVKWSVGGTNASAVTLYSDENCTSPITTGTAISTLTVYAKGISAGSATVTVTSNADSSKTASCNVTVNAASTTTLTITQITSDMLSGYESTATLTADMFPGFIGATAAEAAAWSEVSSTGSPFLIYGFNESGAQVQTFLQGAPRDNVPVSTVGALISYMNQGALVYYVGEPSGNKESAIPATVTANNRTYDGTEKPLVTVNGEPTGGTMQYAVGADATTEPTEGWSTSIPKATNVGTYYVWYKAKGDGDHIDSAPGVVSVTIKEKAAAHTHELKHVDAKEPTCEEDGYEAHYECTVEGCGEWFEDDTKSVPIDKETFIKKATGHKWDKGVVTQEATYDETGIKTYTCTKCNATRVEIIPRKTRSYSDSSDSSSDSDGGGSGSSGNKSGNISTRSIDINGNVIQTQADSGAPVSDRGGNWGNENLSWTYTKSDGNLAKSEWLNLEYNGHTYWYYFDDSTIMQTDWFNYNGATYYFVPEMDGWRGRMATGWQQIGDKWYYFEPTLGASQGQMYRGAMTPDGHVVGADGAWDGNGTAPVGAIHTGTAVIGS